MIIDLTPTQARSLLRLIRGCDEEPDDRHSIGFIAAALEREGVTTEDEAPEDEVAPKAITYRVDHLDADDHVVIDLVTSDRIAAMNRARHLSRTLDSASAYVIRADDGQDVGECCYANGRLSHQEGTF